MRVIKNQDTENQEKLEQNQLEPQKEESQNEKEFESPIPPVIQQLLIKQLQHELSNYTLYRTFANYYYVKGYSKLGEYYEARAEEELLHHNWIWWYIKENDIPMKYPGLEPTNVTITDMLQPFIMTIEREIETTQMLKEILNKAQGCNDYFTYNWLLGHDDKTGKLIEEQIEEESISRAVYDIAKEDCTSWRNKEAKILELYNA